MTGSGFSRFAVRAAHGVRAARARAQLPLVLLLGVCLVAVTAAIAGAAGEVPGLRFTQPGHWVANADEDRVFHINGAAGTVDAEAEVPGIEAGSQVVQGETSGYVVGPSRIVKFGKSNLSVEGTTPAPTGEIPAHVGTVGGPYLVYRKAGTIMRLGPEPATIRAGENLGEPVATPDGTLWLHRLDSGVICRLQAGAGGVSCPVAAPAGHTGALTIVDRRPVFVDITADTLSPVGDDRLGRGRPTGVDLPDDARVASAGVDGRVAILAPTGRRLHLVDATGLGTSRPGAGPVTTDLPDGDYAAPSVTRSSVVLLDRRRNTVLTYSGRGERRQQFAVPADAGDPSLTRREDERVYVDGSKGRQVLVVDHDGSVQAVPVVGARRPDASGAPVGPPAQPRPDPATRPTAPGPRAQGSGPRGPVAAREPDRSNATAPQTRRAGPPVPASPPGMPPNLRVVPDGGTVRVTWGAAAANGAAVTGYRVTWARVSGGGGGAVTRPGSARSYGIAGLTRGVAYRVTVAAQNRAGRGSPAARTVTLPLTRSVTLSRGRTETYNDECQAPECALMHVVMRGFKPNTEYRIVARSSADPSWSNSVTLTTDSRGYEEFERFHYGVVGATVWVEVDGVRSNRLVWRSG